MPNSLRCKIKHLRHNGTLTERECDRILKALEQEPAEWIVDTDDSRRWDRVRFYCSACNGWNTYGKSKYCPNCGRMKRMSRLEEYNKTVKEIEDDRKYNPPPGSREWGLYELEKIKVSMITDIAKSLAVIADNSERKRIFKRRKDERQKSMP